MLSLFEREVREEATGVVLRWYQRAQAASVLSLWRIHQSVLLVSSVGSGKTTTFCHIANLRQDEGRVLILAHRTELVDQAIERLKLYGIRAARDQANDMAEHHRWAERIIVGTVQTISARLKRYRPEDFSTVIIDEAHHGVANVYKKIIAHFKPNPNCKILGVTGTPDRADEAALGQVFDAVAQPVFGISAAIAEGFLVKPLQRLIDIEELDLSNCRTTDGDLNAAQLAKIVENRKLCIALADAIVKEVGDMSTLVFAATVEQAEILSDCLNDIRHGCSGWICGKTPDDERRRTFSDHKLGKLQYLVNVGIATEGTDMPHVQCVANARFTKSRSLYEQISGRALRTEPGVIDGLDEIEQRLAAIAKSSKPNALLLDFVGNSGKHKLITIIDILGGDISKEVSDIVQQRIRKKGKPSDVAEEIEAAKLELKKREERRTKDRERRRGIRGSVNYASREVDPFDVSDQFNRPTGDNAPTPQQIYFLRSHGHAHPERYTRRQASAIIGKEKTIESSSRNGLGPAPSDKQLYRLMQGGCKFTKEQIDAMSFKVWKGHLDAYFAGTFNKINVGPSYAEVNYGEPAF